MLDSFAALYRPFGRYFRSRRLRRFVRRFNVESSTTVLDLGGSEFYWRWCDVRPQVTVVNLAERDLRRERLPWVRADGRKLPFADHSFDIVHCNSVLEHLPDESSRRAMAREIARVGRAYWVQTPNRRFPVEPHTLTPGFHFLPAMLAGSLGSELHHLGLAAAPQLRGGARLHREHPVAHSRRSAAPLSRGYDRAGALRQPDQVRHRRPKTMKKLHSPRRAPGPGARPNPGRFSCATACVASPKNRSDGYVYATPIAGQRNPVEGQRQLRAPIPAGWRPPGKYVPGPAASRVGGALRSAED